MSPLPPSIRQGCTSVLSAWQLGPRFVVDVTDGHLIDSHMVKKSEMEMPALLEALSAPTAHEVPASHEAEAARLLGGGVETFIPLRNHKLPIVRWANSVPRGEA